MFSGLRSSGGRGRLSSNVDKKLKVVSGLLSEIESLIWDMDDFYSDSIEDRFSAKRFNGFDKLDYWLKRCNASISDISNQAGLLDYDDTESKDILNSTLDYSLGVFGNFESNFHDVYDSLVDLFGKSDVSNFLDEFTTLFHRLRDAMDDLYI